ncbi:MAG: DivIVA domain-containing protein [Streptococcaceae bacterium]|jgi:cell division initiation protein|nr:DivIVA domain-containing protein [Streptococcaceae bacterium]
MALNSLDVQNKTFNLQFRGYHKQEVDEFLQIIVNDYDEMTQRIKDNERELKTLQERLRDFDNMKDSLNKSIIVAQDTAENMKAQAEAGSRRIQRDAQQKSDMILDSAQREAREVLQNTYDEARRLVNESDELKRGMRSYYQRITMLIEGQLANIKSTEWEETLKPNPIYVGDSEEKLREIIEHTNQAFHPINDQGEELPPRQGTAPETLESFESALNPGQPQVQIPPVQGKGSIIDQFKEPPVGPNPDAVNLGNNISFGEDQ